MGKKLAIIVPLAVVTGIGVWLSVGDYRSWQYEEMHNYGHGPGELYTPAEEMTERYEVKDLGLRVRYPWGWTLKVLPNFAARVRRAQQQEVPLSWVELVGSHRLAAAEIEKAGVEERIIPKLRFSLGVTDLDSTDLVTAELVKIKSVGARQIGDRDYINSDRGSWTVVTHLGNSAETKAAYLVKGNRLVVVEFDYGPGRDKQYQRTFEEFLQNFLVI